MSPAKPPKKKPRRRKKTSTKDVGLRLLGIVGVGVGAMEERMAELTSAPLDDVTTPQVIAITKEVAVVMSHVRRADEATRAATKKLSNAAVIEYLRNLPTEERDALLADATGDESRGSVFGR